MQQQIEAPNNIRDSLHVYMATQSQAYQGQGQVQGQVQGQIQGQVQGQVIQSVVEEDNKDVPLEEEKQTLQDYVFDIREKIPDGVYKILMEKYCYPIAEYNNGNSDHEELRECRDFIDLLHLEIDALNSQRDIMWKSGYDAGKIEEMNKKRDSARSKYERRKELEQMTPEEKTRDIQLRKIDKKIDFEHRKIEIQEKEVHNLQTRINGFANSIIIAHFINNQGNRMVDTNHISIQLHQSELEIKKRRAKISKSNNAIIELFHKRTQIQSA